MALGILDHVGHDDLTTLVDDRVLGNHWRWKHNQFYLLWQVQTMCDTLLSRTCRLRPLLQQVYSATTRLYIRLVM